MLFLRLLHDDSSVGIGTRPGFGPFQCKIFLSPQLPDLPGAYRGYYTMRTGTPSPGVKRQELEAYHLPLI
jgi:hypothetical protein